nr:hypothetical protein I308_05183 [Cryptococcus tetragattii IND107]
MQHSPLVTGTRTGPCRPSAGLQVPTFCQILLPCLSLSNLNI